MAIHESTRNGAAAREVARPMPLAEEWLRDHAEEYVGRWVALRDDELVAVGDSFSDLHSKLGTLKGVLVTLVT